MGVLCEIPVHRLLQIQEYGRLRFWESVTLNATTLRGSQLHIYIIIFQQYTVISCRSLFIRMPELGMNAQRRFSFTIRKGDRHVGNVVQITGPCSRQMRVTETGNGTVGIIITRNTVPTGQAVIRTQLNHAKRCLSTGIGIPGKICSDKRVYQ